MDRSPTSRRRRSLLKGAGAAAALGALGFPAIVRGQADAIRIGHLTPRTGFLGPLGEYAVMGVNLAVDEINAAGGVMGRKIELIAEDSVNPQTASTKAERLIERDKVVAIIGEISSASGLAIAQVAQRNRIAVLQHRLQLRRAARQVVQPLHVPHRGRQHACTSRARGQALLRDGMVKGKKWYSLTADYAFGHDLLKVAKRFMAANGGEFAADELVPTDAADFSAVPAQDPQCQAGPRRVESRRRADHQLHEAVHGIRTAVSGRRLRLRHRGRVGRGQGQRARHLAAGLGLAGEDARRRRNSPTRS